MLVASSQVDDRTAPWKAFHMHQGSPTRSGRSTPADELPARRRRDSMVLTRSERLHVVTTEGFEARGCGRGNPMPTGLGAAPCKDLPKRVCEEAGTASRRDLAWRRRAELVNRRDKDCKQV